MQTSTSQQRLWEPVFLNSMLFLTDNFGPDAKAPLTIQNKRISLAVKNIAAALSNPIDKNRN
jgi:hypothetical protein